MKTVTLCFLMKEGEICLAMKKRDFGVGKYNGVGGKVKEGETIEQAALREMEEEIGVTSEAGHLRGMGNIEFYFKDKPEWNQHMHIFVVENWDGEPQESEEMKPKWYKIDDIPFDKMWLDDTHWLPHVLDGKKVYGKFYFNEEGDKIEDYKLEKLSD